MTLSGITPVSETPEQFIESFDGEFGFISICYSSKEKYENNKITELKKIIDNYRGMQNEIISLSNLYSSSSSSSSCSLSIGEEIVRSLCTFVFSLSNL